MSGKPLDCVGTDGEVGKHDFVLTGEKEIVHGPGGQEVKLERRTPESQARYYSEKISELVLAQGELRKVVAERDALAKALGRIKAGEIPISRVFAAETLRKLEAGELRKAVV